MNSSIDYTFYRLIYSDRILNLFPFDGLFCPLFLEFANVTEGSEYVAILNKTFNTFI